MKHSPLLASAVLACAPVAVSAGWVYSLPEGNQWWDQGVLEWTDSSGFHNVISNIACNAANGNQLRIVQEGGVNPLALNLDFSVGIEGGYELVSIGGGTLGGTPVTNFVAPPTLKSIDWGAFEQNRNLRSVVLNEGLETIAMNAFNGCTSLESFSGLPSTLTSMGGGVFFGAQKLSGEIVWPAGVSSCNQVFPNTSITSFIATNGLRSIDGYAAFGGCTSLSKIVLGPDFEYAGRRAFGDNSSIKVDMHIYFNSFPSRGFDGSLIDGGKRHAVTFHMEWSARDEWNAWMSTNGVFVTEPPASPYAKGDLEKGSWTDWNNRVWLMWWHVPLATVGGTDYTSLRAAIDAAHGAAIELLAPSVADFTDERVSLAKNESFAVVDDPECVLGYEPGIPDSEGWKLAVSRRTVSGVPVVEYKAVGPVLILLVK